MSSPIFKFLVNSFLLFTLAGLTKTYSQQVDPNFGERFNISCYKVFSPGSDVTVNISSNSKTDNNFQLRLFKITNPIEYFSKVDKNSLRINFDIWGIDRQVLLQYTKLIREWDSPINTSAYFGSNNNLELGKIADPGNYILQAIKGNHVAYCGVIVSSKAIIYKNSGRQVLAYVADSKTGEVIKDTKFSLYNDNRLLQSKNSDSSGLVLFSIKENIDFGDENALLVAQTKDETILSDPYFYFRLDAKPFVAYIYTNQPVYRPGQIVFYKAIIRGRDGNKLLNVTGEKFNVIIRTQQRKEISNQEKTVNEFGSLSGSFKLSDDAELGKYNVIIVKDGQPYFGVFSVEEYKKPEFLVKVKIPKGNYAENDSLNAIISANYYYGSPVSGSKVFIKIFRHTYWRPWWIKSQYSWFYNSFNTGKIFDHSAKELIFQQEGELDKKGDYIFHYRIDSTLSNDYTYTIQAEITDNSRQTITKTKDIFISRGNFNISTAPEKYFVLKGKAIDLNVYAQDFSNLPVKTKFKLIVNYPEQNSSGKNNFIPHADTLYDSTDSSGKSVINFIPRSFYNGEYNYIVIAHDEKGRRITTSGYFTVGIFGNNTLQGFENSVRIVTDKDSYIKGDTLNAFVFLSQPHSQILVSYEAANFLGYKIYNVRGNSLQIKEVLSADFAPSFNIAVTYIFNQQLYTNSKLVGVLDKDKLLKITLQPSKKIYRPGDQAFYKVLVKDQKGNPVKNADLSIDIIDESIYAVKKDNTSNIQDFFLAPKFSFIPAYTSLQNNSFNGASRRILLIDKKITDKNNNSKSGLSELSGKLNSHPGFVDFKNIYAILNNDKNFYKSKTDSLGNFIFANIIGGPYEFFILLDNAEVLYKGTINVNGKTSANFDLGNFQNTIPELPSKQFEGGRDFIRMTSGLGQTISKQGIMFKNMGEANVVQPQIRSNIVDALLWKADLITDENGEAVIHFRMPDNLTTWRTTVKGITQNSEVGQTENKIISRKNLFIRIIAPRFFRQGDEVIVSTIIHNYLQKTKDVKISFSAKNVMLEESKIDFTNTKVLNKWTKNKTYKIRLENNSEIRIDWKIKITEPADSARLFAEALTDEESDALEITVPIHPAGIKTISSLSAEVSGNYTNKNLYFTIPNNSELRTANLNFSIAPSIAGSILKALDDLAGYPYGCVEQTMSRFLPAIITINTLRKIDAPIKSKTIKNLPLFVKAGLKRLYSFQHKDGGWGWWINDETNPYMTSYVIYGMNMAKEAGYKVDSLSFKYGLDNMISQLKGYNNLDPTTTAFMLYSYTKIMAGKDFNHLIYINIINTLIKKELNPYALSLLALTLKSMNSQTLLNSVLEKLKNAVTEEKSNAYWSGKEWHYSWQQDRIQTTAFVVKAFIKNNFDPELISKSIHWLLGQKQGFSWQSTQQTATVVFALTDYLKYTNEMNADYSVSILLNGKKILNKHFAKDNIFSDEPTINIHGSENKLLRSGINKITIIKSGKGTLYFSGIDNYYSNNKNLLNKNCKIKVTQNYYILKPKNDGNRIVYSEVKVNDSVSSGDLILVKAHVETDENDLHYLLFEDNLPSGFAAVINESNFQIENESKNNYSGGYRIRNWNRIYAEKEYYDDKVSFFITNSSRTMDFSFIIRAEIPGNFNIPPAKCYLMYYPEISGRSKPAKIQVFE